MKNLNVFFELIQVAVGTREKLSNVPTEDVWLWIYETAVKQSLVGVIFLSIEILNKLDSTVKPPMKLVYNWLGGVTKIENQNQILNEASTLVYRIFKEGGLRSCILKGQGVSLMYDVICKDQRLTTEGIVKENGHLLKLRRQSGDIDIWVEGRRDDILKYLKENHLNTRKVVIHHVDTSIVEGVETEIHFHPSYTYDFLRNKKYKRFFKEEANQQFNHYDEHAGFAYPTNRFNAVYLMMHIFRHVFNEGIGLRQLMDYYFVLINLTDEERKWAYGKLKWMGLEKVTSAIMYVIKTVFQMDDKFLLCYPSEEKGVYLLEEIIQGGNFGKFGDQYEDTHSGYGFNQYLKNLLRLGKVYSLCPSEVLWAPVWKFSHWLWRKWNGYL